MKEAIRRRGATPLTPVSTRPPWTWPWFGPVMATAAVLLSALTDFDPARDHHAVGLHWSGRVMGFAAAAVLVLLARRRFPRAALAATLGLVVAATAVGAFDASTVVAVAVAVFTAVQHLPRRTATLVVSGVALAVAGCAFAGGRWQTQHVLVVLLGAALGEAARSQREQLTEARERAERAEATRDAIARRRVAEARLSIARDLHDVVGHQIAVINLHAGAASSALATRPDDAARSLAVIRTSSRDVLTEIGDLMAALRDPTASDAGPAGLARLDDVVRDFGVHGLAVRRRVEGEPRDLPGAVDATALRVVQEALTNAHKHGADARAHLLLEYLPASLRVTVTNRIGTGVAPLSVGTGLGVVGMTERVESVRGTMTSGDDGAGVWRVVVDLPTDTPGDQP
ncbi:sensor histidine kinase [Xylanimonas protaetiae]|uniref:histidine kinase n=1 Tax=Xylanimonas protaetiae TaxID=2509457 RepID=A0A4P6F588_9MICO|nr:histidine kinase [Xylanimonas protaetiae]QAY70526.1 two-component sensor histidine kinase [Xylanimonas protaetiae]